METIVWCLVCALPAASVVLAVRRRNAVKRVAEPTFVFADLAGYTALTERLGDEAAANLARAFRRTMCSMSREYGAHQIKSMGDGVMILAKDPGAAIALAARAVEDVGRRADFLPVRVGVHTGPAVRRGCDWYGSAVNVAARLAREAQPNEALISGTTHALARGKLRERLTKRRDLALRGVDRPVAAWRLA